MQRLNCQYRFSFLRAGNNTIQSASRRDRVNLWHNLFLIALLLTSGSSQLSAQSSTSEAAKVPAEKAPAATLSYGSTPPEALPPLFQQTKATHWLEHQRVRAYGWIDGGYTYASTGDGLMKIAPEPNRYGNRALLNGAWLVVERSTAKDQWSWGFRTDFYGGSDAALLRPMNSFGPQGKRFGTDFRQAYLTIHMPVLSAKGVDWQLGRQNMPLGYETLMGPYRPLYSQTYYWIYFQVAATAATATWHATDSLDLMGGVAFGYNTVFKTRGRAPVYLVRSIYRPSKNNTILGSVFTGPKPAAVATGHAGSWQTVAEAELRHDWSPHVTQAILVNSSWNSKDQKTHGTTATHGAFTITTVHLNKQLDLNTREEWFYDAHGLRTGVPGHFVETTAGVNIMPNRWVNFRPEVRGDFSGQRSFGALNATRWKRNQLTVGFDLILKFSAMK